MLKPLNQHEISIGHQLDANSVSQADGKSVEYSVGQADAKSVKFSVGQAEAKIIEFIFF